MTDPPHRHGRDMTTDVWQGFRPTQGTTLILLAFGRRRRSQPRSRARFSATADGVEMHVTLV